MGIILYAVGFLAVVVGGFMLVPTMRIASSAADALSLLGAPITFNSITLILYGALLIFLGRMLSLMNQIARKTIWLDVWADEGKVLLKCPKCLQQLRAPAGKSGTINCPKCGNKFDAQT